MNIVQSNARFEDEDKAMADYLDEQDRLTEALYDDAQAIAEAEAAAAEDGAEYHAFMQEEAEAQYREYLEGQIQDALAPYLPDDVMVIIRHRDGDTYVTTVHPDAMNRGHATSLSAGVCRELDAESHSSWFTLEGGAETWHVTWRMI